MTKSSGIFREGDEDVLGEGDGVRRFCDTELSIWNENMGLILMALS